MNGSSRNGSRTGAGRHRARLVNVPSLSARIARSRQHAEVGALDWAGPLDAAHAAACPTNRTAAALAPLCRPRHRPTNPAPPPPRPLDAAHAAAARPPHRRRLSPSTPMNADVARPTAPPPPRPLDAAHAATAAQNQAIHTCRFRFAKPASERRDLIADPAMSTPGLDEGSRARGRGHQWQGMVGRGAPLCRCEVAFRYATRSRQIFPATNRFAYLAGYPGGSGLPP